MPPNLKAPLCLFVAILLGAAAGQLALAQATPNEAVALEEINKIARAKPDSAIALLLPYLSSPADSIRGKALNYLGNAFYFKSQYDSAIRYFGLSADIFKASGDEENLAKNYNNMGVAHYFLSQYQKAFEYHRTAMEIRERTNDPQVTSSYNNLGLVLTELGSATEALTYYKKSLDAKIRYRQFAGLSTTLTNISNIFRSDQQFDSALYYSLQNLHHLDSVPDQRNQATCYNNLSITYIDLGDYQNAESYALKALTLEKKLERGFEIVNVCKNLAVIYHGKNQNALADSYLDSALALVKNAGDYRGVLGVYTLQAKLDSLRGNMGAAYFHLQDYVQAKARFDETEQKDLVLELERKYEGELKEQKILELEQVNTIKDLEAEQSKQFRLYLLVVVVLLLVAAGVLYSRFRLKQRTAQLLDAKNRELQDLNQVKDRLFAIISHDLKSPLSSFHTVTSTLNQYYTQISPEDIRKYLEKLENAAKSLEEQMKNLLEWSVNQIAERKLKTEQVDLADMADNLKTFFQLNLDVKRQNMYVQMDTPLLVETDREYIQTVLRNLISNAIKFTPPEGSVWVKGRVTGDTVVLQVEDSGIGIAKEDFAKLFTLTADKKSIGSSPEKGTGLGLVLVKEMMDRLGGTIGLSSEPGKGTSFTLTLSRRAVEKAA